jgi:transformation/transcription domain-associated protein
MELLESPRDLVTLEDLYEQSCNVRQVDPDAPQLLFMNMMRNIPGAGNVIIDGNAGANAEGYLPAQALEQRRKWHERVCTSLVPDTILSNFIFKSILGFDELYAFKKEFAAQTAMNGYLSYILKIAERAPYRLMFSTQTGKIKWADFYPVYGDNYTVECNEAVPFRLTRNITQLLGPHLVEGVMSGVMSAVNACFTTNQDILKNYLYLFTRDDILSWHNNKSPIISDVAQRHCEAALKDKVSLHVNAIQKRIQNMTVQQPSANPVIANPPSANLPSSGSASNAGSSAQSQQQAAALIAAQNRAKLPIPVNQKVDELIASAMNKENLIQMAPNWFPAL